MTLITDAAAEAGTSEGGNRRRSRSVAGPGIRPALIAALVVAVTAGALFGAVQLSQEVARASAELHLADEAARAATVVRSHIALAAIGSAEQQSLSALEAESALEALTDSLSGLEASGGAGESVERGMRFAETSRVIVDSIGTGEVDQETADLRFHEMMTSLDGLRRDLVEHIDLLDSSYNLLGIVLGVATVGLAPLMLVLWTRSMARKTMQVRELSLQLKHESDVRDAHNTVLRTVVHEFRTPLTGITGLAALLEEPSVRRSSEAAEMVAMIRNEAEDMSQLTDDILTSAGLEMGQLEIRVESVDIADAAKRTVTMFERRGVAVEVACAAGSVIGDELRVRQVLKNLVSNAAKYGGPTITVSGDVSDGFYEVSVADDGDGVPDEILDRLFDPFPHGGRGAPSQSVGLGLFIVHELVEAMNGTVDYRRDADISTFTVRLPLDEQTKAARSLPPALSVGA